MKTAWVITLAVIMLAAGGLLIYYLADNSSRRQQNKFRGTLVKEYGEWKISCM